jgi:FKBP-type peptidyl-prolyl cis-trans isomerase
MAKSLVLLGCVATATIAGCFPEKLSQPKCTATPFTIASVSVDTVTTTTGLRYIVGAPGAGGAVTWCTNVAVHYAAYLLDGTQFDETRTAAIPLAFTPGVGSLIDGIEQGVIGMRGGGTRRLIIPSSLGFGDQPRRDAAGNTVVPGKSTVVYDIEVVEVGVRPAQ